VIETDVSDHRAVESMVSETVEHFGGLHLAVNNAGITGLHNILIEDYEIEWWNRIIAIDLGGVIGVFPTRRAFAKRL
jgi:NAD(P)-dependent dehydrogenase (short-subunit alcohol dehydrogenase family)